MTSSDQVAHLMRFLGVSLDADYDTRNYVHCNWGWNGHCDGFFISDGFDTTVNPPILGPNDKGGTDKYKFVNENEYAILNY